MLPPIATSTIYQYVQITVGEIGAFSRQILTALIPTQKFSVRPLATNYANSPTFPLEAL